MPGLDAGRVSLHRVSFGYLARPLVVRDISLRLRVGEYVGLVGGNGSGKTTLARLLSGLLIPTSGKVEVEGYEPKNLDIASAPVVFVGSEPESQILTTSVFDEVAFSLRARPLPPDEIMARTNQVLAWFDLEAHAERHPGHLSAGEQLRLLVAAAIARGPLLLVLDEVASMVDTQHWRAIIARVCEWCRQDTLGLMVITHRLEDVRSADRVVVMHAGAIVVEGSAATIYARAQQETDWRIELPLVYQVGQLLSADCQRELAELSMFAPETKAPSHVV